MSQVYVVGVSVQEAYMHMSEGLYVRGYLTGG